MTKSKLNQFSHDISSKLNMKKTLLLNHQNISQLFIQYCLKQSWKVTQWKMTVLFYRMYSMSYKIIALKYYKQNQKSRKLHL